MEGKFYCPDRKGIVGRTQGCNKNHRRPIFQAAHNFLCLSLIIYIIGSPIIFKRKMKYYFAM